MDSAKILIAEDHPIYREALAKRECEESENWKPFNLVVEDSQGPTPGTGVYVNSLSLFFLNEK